MHSLLQIVPRIWPAIDGVGDFARQLGSELNFRFGLESRYLVGNDGGSTESGVCCLEERDARSLTDAVEKLCPDLILLHYSGYGYDDRGVPRWLVDGLRESVRGRGKRLSVFFHEIWASGPPWRSEFYLRGAQKRLVMQLSAMAGASFTSTRRMQRLIAAPRLSIVPIPSPVSPVSEISQRCVTGGLKLIVFGQEPNRERSLNSHANLLRGLFSRGELEAVIILGKDAHVREAARFGSEIAARAQAVPNADWNAVRDCLSASDALLSFYPADLVTKSSAIMSALACGCPVILPRDAREEAFIPAPPFLVCDGSPEGIAALLDGRSRGSWEAAAERGKNWSMEHADWDAAVGRISASLGITAERERVAA